MVAKSKSAYKVTLPSEREIVMTRVFNAPRELVFKAHVDPTLIAQWWGLRGNTTIVDQLDARPGGKWRFVQRRPDGSEEGFRGEFREIVPPERFTWTFEWEGLPGHVGVEKYTFQEHAGQTTLTTTSVFDTTEDRDGVIASGMEGGANESADRLEELLASLAA
jgi:uncharacterized protein YndB with AHSA1/START domain